MALKIPPPLLMLMAALLMTGLAQIDPLAVFYLPYRGSVCAALSLTAFGFAFTAIRQFLQVRTTITPIAPHKASELVISGAFRITRNPMYVGLVLLLAALALFLGSWLAITVLPLFIAYLTAFQILPEEKALTEKFGAPYLAYQQRVRR